jgi:hypothetical protein
MTDETDDRQLANHMIKIGDVLRTAVRLIDEHGDAAVTYAEARAGELRDAGDATGEEMWMLIRELLVKLISESRPSDATIH